MSEKADINAALIILEEQATKYLKEITHLEAQKVGLEKAINDKRSKHAAIVEALNSIENHE